MSIVTEIVEMTPETFAAVPDLAVPITVTEVRDETLVVATVTVIENVIATATATASHPGVMTTIGTAVGTAPGLEIDSTNDLVRPIAE
jgi:uncharacterized membrane protein YgaE (UPF0421/DUF939 family)